MASAVLPRVYGPESKYKIIQPGIKNFPYKFWRETNTMHEMVQCRARYWFRQNHTGGKSQ